MDDLMAIGEFSRESGLSAKQLRSYAVCGLVTPAAVDASTGYRYYTPGQLHVARLIDALRRSGMPVADIATLLREQSAEVLDEWARLLDESAVQRRSALQEARALLGGGTKATRGTTMTSLIGATRCETGLVRDNNEDVTLCRDDLVAVADGMGGAPGGEIASAVAIAVLDAAFTGRSRDELEAGSRAAGRAIFERAAGGAMEGMGSTLCAVGVVGPGQVAVVNVGDSRAYLGRDGAVACLTADHTVAAELVRQGELSEEEAVAHPHRGVLTRVLGVGPTVDTDCEIVSVEKGDRLLVCTDGLYNELSQDDLQRLLLASGAPAEAATALVDRALSAGGRDNISVVVADVS